VIVKICGVTTPDDAVEIAKLGADMLGLNFYSQSPRYISVEVAQRIYQALQTLDSSVRPLLVGVFVNATYHQVFSTLSDVPLDYAQLSGDESGSLVEQFDGRAYKAIRPPSQALAVSDAQHYAASFPTDQRVPSLLLDAYNPKLYGGTGEQAGTEVALAVKAQAPRLMLAGGLTPTNVAERIQAIRPWGVDTASGVESAPGQKDLDLTADFIQAAKSA